MVRVRARARGMGRGRARGRANARGRARASARGRGRGRARVRARVRVRVRVRVIARGRAAPHDAWHVLVPWAAARGAHRAQRAVDLRDESGVVRFHPHATVEHDKVALRRPEEPRLIDRCRVRYARAARGATGRLGAHLVRVGARVRVRVKVRVRLLLRTNPDQVGAHVHVEHAISHVPHAHVAAARRSTLPDLVVQTGGRPVARAARCGKRGLAEAGGQPQEPLRHDTVANEEDAAAVVPFAEARRQHLERLVQYMRERRTSWLNQICVCL